MLAFKAYPFFDLAILCQEFVCIRFEDERFYNEKGINKNIC
jgi:hypothetical protein